MPNSPDSDEVAPIEPGTDRTSFFAELKRRKVFRVAATYIIVAWIIIQVAAATFPGFEIPMWAFRFVVLMLILGFPVALVLAWAFELTPEGIKLTRNVSTEQKANTSQAKRGWLAIGFAAALPTVIFGALAVFFYFRGGDARAALVGEKSIAVLPFTAFSTDQEEQFFADGLSDTILHKLAQLQDIQVISRSSSFQYRGDSVDVRKVGEELKISTILEGSVQRSGDRLRIIAQLVKTSDGSHIWSKTFDRNSEDTFAIQDEIADAVVSSLSVDMSPEEQDRLAHSGTRSVEAYERLARLKERSRSVDGFEMSPDEFLEVTNRLLEESDRILEIDPNYAEVYRFRSGLHNSILFVAGGSVDWDLEVRKGFEAIRMAMRLEPDNPLNFVYYADSARRSGDAVTGEIFSRIALQKLPNSVDALSTLALSLMGQSRNPEEFYQLVMKEYRLDPNAKSLNWRRRYFGLAWLGRFDEARDLLLERIGKEGSRQLATSDFGNLISGELGRHFETAQEFVKVRGALGDEAAETFLYAWVELLARVGMEKELVAWSEVALVSERVRWLLFFLRGEYPSDTSFPDALPYDRTVECGAYYMEGEAFERAIDLFVQVHELLDSRGGKIPLIQNNWELNAALRLVVCYRMVGEDAAGSRLLSAIDEYIEERTYDGVFADKGYQMCYLALLKGDKATALAELRTNIELDGSDFVPLRLGESFEGPMFQALEGDPEFEALTAEYERRRAENAEKISDLTRAAGY